MHAYVIFEITLSYYTKQNLVWLNNAVFRKSRSQDPDLPPCH